MNEFKWVRSIYGSGEDAKKKYNYIPDYGVNEILKSWHAKQTPREITIATPSSLSRCPRSVWLELHGVEPTNNMGWGTEQRMLLGRLFENKMAEQFDDEGILLKHWKDDKDGDSEKLELKIDGITLLKGTPDFLIKLDGKIAVSDAKTSRSDSYGYLDIDESIFDDGGWYKNRLQLTAYYLLLHNNKDWMAENKLPLPEVCHLFSYALDDGIVRREFSWEPTTEDVTTVIEYAKRYNEAIVAKTCPDCTCRDTKGMFEMKFCKYGTKSDSFAKVNDSCCNDNLIEGVTK